VLDEVAVSKSKDPCVAIYQLATGAGKGRLARDGSLRDTFTWRVMVLSTGEIKMAIIVIEDQ
jgi:uncharacterized protein (DUF927 family)